MSPESAQSASHPHHLRSPEHFLQRLGLQIGPVHDGRSTVRLASDRPPDVGLLATLVDVLGGSMLVRLRPGAGVPTTNLELHGLDRLTGAGVVGVAGRVASMSTRRATIECTIDAAGNRAFASVAFAVRGEVIGIDDPAERDGASPPARAIDIGGPRPPFAGPLWSFIGARQRRGGADLEIGPWIHNNSTALQGGATVALLEAAALTALRPGELISHVAVSYHRQVRGVIAGARVRTRTTGVVIVDAYTDEIGAPCATAVFGTRDHCGPAR